MPGPRGKGKSKPKAAAPRSTQPAPGPDPFVGDIDNVEGWNVIVKMFCDHLKLPGM
jgi:hypothetical protein